MQKESCGIPFWEKFEGTSAICNPQPNYEKERWSHNLQKLVLEFVKIIPQPTIHKCGKVVVETKLQKVSCGKAIVEEIELRKFIKPESMRDQLHKENMLINGLC